MCSILGEISFDRKIFLQSEFIDASNTMLHRGPDKKGYVTDNKNFQFAFNRLSIIDTSSTGDQPMTSNCGRYICVFNGEIYNFKKIYEDIKNNFAWKGSSDTEVLLNAWISWGSACLNKIDGMFAFSIWDKKSKKLTIARDKVGEKPLYYYKNKNSILFSSRPAPILKLLPNLRKTYDTSSIALYLEAGYFPRNKSIFSGIKKLEPGSYIDFRENNFSIKKYWSANNFSPNFSEKKSLNLYVDECESLLKKSILDRLSSDKPLGFFLSGGVDSSLIVALASTITNKENIKAFNLGFDHPDFDESADASFVSNTLGISLEKHKLTPSSLIKLIPNMYQKFDEPFFDSACFPLMAISEFAKRKVDVVLAGDGGDELFGGYKYYSIIKILSIPGLSKKLIGQVFSFLCSKYPSHQAKLLSHVLELQCPIRQFSFIRSIKKDFISVMLDDNMQQDILQAQFLNSSEKMNNNANIIDKVMRLDFLHTLNDDYLQKTDLSTMAHSLECRSPFLATNLIEWSLGVPSKFKVSYLQKKIILKKLAEKFFPKKFIYKKKKGFELPIKHWLREDLFQWSRELTHENKNYNNLPIDQKKVIEIFNLHISKKRDCHPYLWAILMLLDFNRKNLTN
jgi:asparagine synthase (glutamine-hydrolysing)